MEVHTFWHLTLRHWTSSSWCVKGLWCCHHSGQAVKYNIPTTKRGGGSF